MPRYFFFFSSRRRHTRLQGDWSSDVCSSDLGHPPVAHARGGGHDVNRLVDDLRRVAVGGTPERREVESDLHAPSSQGLVSRVVRSYTSVRSLVQAGVGMRVLYFSIISTLFDSSPTRFRFVFDSRKRGLDGRRRGAACAGGKSGLHRAGCWLTARGGDPTDQCHRKQTAARKDGKGETVR